MFPPISECPSLMLVMSWIANRSYFYLTSYRSSQQAKEEVRVAPIQCVYLVSTENPTDRAGTGHVPSAVTHRARCLVQSSAVTMLNS